MDLYTKFRTTAEATLLLGASFMAILYGLKRIYGWTKTLDEVLEHAVQGKKDTDEVTQRLMAHVNQEEARDKIRDVQLIEIVADLKEITREIRPNGGSSMKDTVNHIASEVGHVKERLATVEQWKKDVE